MDVRIWWRWWAMAAFAHVVGTPTADGLAARGLVNVLVGWVAIALIVRPEDRRLRTALAAGIVGSALVEAPLLGNHWWLAAAVSTAALLARPWSGDAGDAGDAVGADATSDDEAFAGRFAPTARVLLLVFYSFAAFAKLNTGFLDPIESCARFFANQGLSFWQLPEVPGDGPIAPTLPYIALVIELLVPVLLVLRPTRRYGVWLAIVFHLVLTIDLPQHFYDFTLVLVPLFALFAPPTLLATVDRSLPRLRLGDGRPWMLIFGVQVAAFHLPLGRTLLLSSILLAWVTWVVVVAFIVRGLFRAWRGGDDRPTAQIPLRPAGIGAAVLVAVTVLNGLSPYLELKTATGFNMYANLVTGDGESNHLLVPRTAGLRDGRGATVEIVSSDDDGLAEYVDEDFAIPVANLRDYLADNPEITVTYLLDGAEIEHRPDRPGPLTPEPLAWWDERFSLFRAVPLTDPPACQNAWLPAR